MYLEFPPEEGRWVMGSKTDEEIREVLRTKSSGVCVYQMDNNVVDHQVVNMEFAHGQTVSFTMCLRSGRAATWASCMICTTISTKTASAAPAWWARALCRGWRS